MKDKEKNLDLWLKVSKTNPKHTKSVRSGGRTFTAIDAYYQIYVATALWGEYGKDWGLFDIEHSTIDLHKGQKLLTGKAIFKAPNGVNFPIHSSVFLVVIRKAGQPNEYLDVDQDAYKKLDTDMLTKALSKLGFSYDVFSGQYKDNKYS